MSTSSPQEPHNRQQTRTRSLSLSSGGEISARAEEIQSALEVQVRRLFERFGGGALWGRNNESGEQETTPPEPSRDDTVNSVGTDADHHGHLRGGKKKWSQKLYSPLRDLLGLVHTALLAVMNAAVAIFGVGVGVGLILGDSFRGSANGMVNDLAGDDMEHEQRRRGRGRDGRNARQSGQAERASREDELIGGYVERPSLSNLPAQ